jgi:DNA-binding transcriptional MerR regulator
MSEDLISKKDLLQLTGISYGQLYRWKRKNIIPEDWFMKKSSFTGQETFFPKQKVLERIERIKELKDGQSLDDIARVFSTNEDIGFDAGQVTLSLEQIPKQVLQIYQSLFPNTKLEQLGTVQLCSLLFVNDWLLKGSVTIEEVKQFLILIETHKQQIILDETVVIYIRKFGVGTWVIGKQHETFVDQKDAILINVALSNYLK